MRLVVTGGGTGGHIYPAIASAKAMIDLVPSSKVLFVGTSNGMEKEIVPRENLDFMAIRSSGIVGKSFAKAAKGALLASLGFKDAVNILRRFKPDVVLGTGGYVSGPCILAARILGIPSAIQEQNAVPGKTNLFLSRYVGRTFLAWDYSRRYFPKKIKVMVTGNPVKPELFQATKEEARKFFGLKDGFTLLILGGSRGASTLCEIGERILNAQREKTIDFQVIFITGKEYYRKVERLLGTHEENGIEGLKVGNIIMRNYVYNMEMAYHSSDLVLARAGGMTLSEITALGLPGLIIPSPNVVGNHQEFNARALEEKGAAIVIRENGRHVDKAFDMIVRLSSDRAKLDEMSKASLSLGHKEAAITIAKELINLAKGS